jgi:hypothetical protein
MKKIVRLFALGVLVVGLNSCVWLAVAGIGAAGGAAGAYMVDKN